jgi:hypothetical protein
MTEKHVAIIEVFREALKHASVTGVPSMTSQNPAGLPRFTRLSLW